MDAGGCDGATSGVFQRDAAESLEAGLLDAGDLDDTEHIRSVHRPHHVTFPQVFQLDGADADEDLESAAVPLVFEAEAIGGSSSRWATFVVAARDSAARRLRAVLRPPKPRPPLDDWWISQDLEGGNLALRQTALPHTDFRPADIGVHLLSAPALGPATDGTGRFMWFRRGEHAAAGLVQGSWRNATAWMSLVADGNMIRYAASSVWCATAPALYKFTSRASPVTIAGRVSVNTDMMLEEDSSRVRSSVPCSGMCGYAITWHASHCCDRCTETQGAKHGTRCDQCRVSFTRAVPCVAACGYLRTWHPSHCCSECADSHGSKHGRQCEHRKALESKASATLRPCPGGCGFMQTWHKSHCCGSCAVSQGLRHGDRCERRTQMESTPSVNTVPQKACAGNCGFERTWHVSHCCDFCAISNGAMHLHDPKCDRRRLAGPGSLCAARCGFLAPRHSTHCCGMCEATKGMSHGDMCEKLSKTLSFESESPVSSEPVPILPADVPIPADVPRVMGSFCVGGCGYARTWHRTHCCGACKDSKGQAHGSKCDRRLATSDPCGGRCGFARTWHASHCCGKCKTSNARFHGDRCDRRRCLPGFAPEYSDKSSGSATLDLLYGVR